MKPAYPNELVGTATLAVPFSEVHRDAAEYLCWLRDYDVIRTLNLPAYWTPISADEMRRYCEQLWRSDTDYFFALIERESERFVGTLRAGHINWRARSADIGIMIGDKQSWGKGLAQDAIAMLSRWLIDGIGMRRLTAGAMAVNPAMIRVFEKLGFQQEGLLRQQDPLREGGYCDHVLLACLQDELVATGPQPTASDLISSTHQEAH